MNSSSSPNKPASQSHQGNLPFSIDHILSSPIKQAAAARAAVVASQQHQANDMLNSLFASNQDALSSAMLNDQLALLATGQHHQQQQRQHQQPHLLNPTALAAAAAAAAAASSADPQQHQWQQQQQQQLMAAAAVNFGAIQAQSQTLNPLNPLVASQQNQTAQPNLLSYFMAYMLLQQQQQQQQQQPHQIPNLQHQSLHTQRSALNNLGSAHIGNSITNILNHNNQYHANSPFKQINKSKTYESPLASAVASSRRSSPPLIGQNNHLNYAQHHQVNYHQQQRLSVSPQSSPSSGSNRHQFEVLPKERSKLASGTKKDSSFPTASAASSSSGFQQSSSAGDNNQSTALSSLSNFVSESLAPILDDQMKDEGNKYFKTRTTSGNSSPDKSPFSSSGMKRMSDSGRDQSRKSLANDSNRGFTNKSKSFGENNDSNGLKFENPLSGLDLISPNTQATKVVGSTINTTLAKAPAELISKQPPWVFCTRYSDRPSSGPRTRRLKSKERKPKEAKGSADEKRPRTAFTSEQLEKLRQEFQENSYLDERRRKDLADRLNLNENQIKIWFQNKRAKMKKQNPQPNPLRGLLVAGGLYNHSTATSDCSESYANGNDEDDGREANEDLNVENETSFSNNSCHDGDEIPLADVSGSNSAYGRGNLAMERKRAVGGDTGTTLSENGAAKRLAGEQPAHKKARLNPGGSSSDDGNDRSSQMGDALAEDEDDERVISVS